MKKVLLSITLVFYALLLSGCGNNKVLKCTSETDNQNGTSIKTSINYIFEGDFVNKVEQDLEFKFDDKYASLLELSKKALENQYKTYSDAIEYKITTNVNSIKVKISYSVDKLSETDKIMLDMVNTKVSYKEVKETLEKEGFTCK